MQWESRQAAVWARRGGDGEAHLFAQPEDQATAPQAEPEHDYHSAFAWAPSSSSGPTTVAGIWRSGTEPEQGSRPLALGWQPQSSELVAVAQGRDPTPSETEKTAPDDNQVQIWSQKTPGRLRFWTGTEHGTQWTDLGDKLAPTESLEEYNRRLDQKYMAEMEAIDSAIDALTAAVADLEQKIPALERDRNLQKAARNFKEVGQLRKEIIETTATLASKRVELDTQKRNKAAKKAEKAARTRPPVETRIVARFRSPAVDG